ncbi:hypothetical protein GQ457_05G023870 [Hibiscus cannabinus]
MPDEITTKLNSLIVKFIWGAKDGRTIYWIKWEALCKPKMRGGLGLFDLRLMNRVLLNKWAWRYGCETNSLWRKVVNAKYIYDPPSLIPKAIEVASKKIGKVKEFGCLGSNGWEWKIEMRRRLFDWELGILEEFLNTLNRILVEYPVRTKSNGVGHLMDSIKLKLIVSWCRCMVLKLTTCER